MKYMLVFASEDSWETVDTVQVEAPDFQMMRNSVRQILSHQGIEEETINDIIVKYRYYIQEIDYPDVSIGENGVIE